MGKYLILGNQVFYEQAQQRGLIALDEFLSMEFVKEEKSYVFLMDVKFECLVRASEPRAFSAQPMIQQIENLQQGLTQHVLVDRSLLEKVLNSFERGSVEKCLPYALSVRGTLMKENIFQEQRITIVFERWESMILVFVFEGGIVLQSRFFMGLDMSRVLNEIGRGFHRSGVLEKKDLFVVLNDADMQEPIRQQDFFKEASLMVLEYPSLGFLYVEEIHFRVNFLLPQDERALQIKKEKKVWMHKMFLGGLTLFFCGVFWIGGVVIKKHLIVASEQHRQENNRLREILEEYQKKIFFQKIQNQKVPLSPIIQTTMQKMPLGWKLEKMTFEPQLTGRVLSQVKMITVGDKEYVCSSQQKNCQISSHMEQGQMMQTLTFDWSAQK